MSPVQGPCPSFTGHILKISLRKVACVDNTLIVFVYVIHLKIPEYFNSAVCCAFSAELNVWV